MPPRKRPSKSVPGGAPASKRGQLSWSRSLFGQVLEEFGVGLGSKEAITLSVEPTVLQKKLDNSLRNKPNLDKSVREFSEGLSEYCSDECLFRAAICPAVPADGATISVRGGGLDSLVRILLGVPSLQSAIIAMLLNKLCACTSSASSSYGNKQELSTLILGQLTMLDHLVDGKEFCSKLTEVVDVVSMEIKREIISALPYIVDDPHHDEAAVLLKKLLNDCPSLTAAVMDALSNLIISNEMAAEIIDVAMDYLSSACVNDLPAMLRFLLQHVTAKNSQEVISELRSKLQLKFSPMHSNMISSTPHSSSTSLAGKASSEHFVVFDTIAAITRLQKPVADGWMKVIEAESGEHKEVDVLVLLFLHTVSGRKRSVESLLVSKVKSGAFPDDLLSHVLGSHAKALTEYFPSILSLCHSLMCSSVSSVSLFAASLYQHLFTAFDIPYKQEVVAALVMHINNGSGGEISLALDTLFLLVSHNLQAMQRFTIIVKGALDRLECLNTAQIRRLYEVLTMLALTQHIGSSSLGDEMRILIRKQLLHSEQRYRHMGIIGAVMSIKQLSSNTREEPFSQDRPSPNNTSQPLLDDVMSMCTSNVESMILFCEEMAVVAPCLDTHTLTVISEQVTSNFQDEYLIEISDSIPTDCCLSHGLDNVDEEGGIALNILPMVGGAKADSLRSMAARFRLLRVCERALNNSLDGIDALLGCPVVLCAETELTKEGWESMSVSKREEIILSLFHIINWFRELVCAFSNETDPDMRGKVLLRLSGISTLIEALDRGLALTTNWTPPLVNTWEPVGRSKKRSDVNLASITAATIQAIDKETTVLPEKSLSTGEHVRGVSEYFREFDLSAFTSLRFGVVCRTFLDSEEHTKSRDELKLHPPQLIILLEDLLAKISVACPAFRGSSKSCGDREEQFTGDELAQLMITLLPSLCDYLESSSAFFSFILENNDGIVDAGSTHTDYPHHCLCMYLLLKCLTTFLAWPPLQDKGHLQKLTSCVETLAERMKTTPTGPTLPHLATDACKYFEGFAEVLPTLSCAHYLCKLLVTLVKLCGAPHMYHTVAEICGRLLKRSWLKTESTSLRRQAVEYMLKYHIEWGENPLGVIEVIGGGAALELLGDDALAESTLYPTLTKASHSWFYRVMMVSLVHQLKTLPTPKKGILPSHEELGEHMHLLDVAVRVLFILVNQVKSFQKSSVLSYCLKNSRLFMEVFLKSGMSILDSFFKERKNDVLALLKSMQQNTRMLQTYCGHSKVSRDSAAVDNVPQLKRTLEQFLFKVKELCSNHHCEDAFWMGNLKNRDITGKEILSQPLSTTADDDQSEGEEGSVTHSTSTDQTTSEVPHDPMAEVEY